MSFNLTIQWEDHFVIPQPFLRPHLGDEGIIYIFSDVLVEAQGQDTTIEETAYDELMFLAIIDLISNQQSPHLTTLGLIWFY